MGANLVSVRNYVLEKTLELALEQISSLSFSGSRYQYYLQLLENHNKLDEKNNKQDQDPDSVSSTICISKMYSYLKTK